MNRCEHTGRRSGLSRRCILPEGHGAPMHTYGPIAAVSDGRAVELRQYRPLRGEFLRAHRWCQFPLGCREQSTEIQHLRGRRGDRLNDVTNWAASCHTHNQWAEEHTGEAYEIGWLIRVEGVA